MLQSRDRFQRTVPGYRQAISGAAALGIAFESLRFILFLAEDEQQVEVGYDSVTDIH